MNKKRITALAIRLFTILLANAALQPFAPVQAAAGESRVSVRATGFHNDTGQAQIKLWSTKVGFPKDDSKAFRSATVRISGGAAEAVFVNIPYADYAVSVVHDENSNGKLDTKFPGIPTEGYGISNGVRGKLGPPPFEAAKTSVSEPQQVLAIVVKY